MNRELESFRAPPGAMDVLGGEHFTTAMGALFGSADGLRFIVAHQSPGRKGRKNKLLPYDGCEVCGGLVMLNPKMVAATDDPAVRVVCVECSWAATQAVAWRESKGVC